MWLHDPRTELPLQNALNFAKLINDLQNRYFVSSKYRECLNKINPFVQKKWADPKFNYKPRVEEDVFYFQSRGAVRKMVGGLISLYMTYYIL